MLRNADFQPLELKEMTVTTSARIAGPKPLKHLAALGIACGLSLAFFAGSAAAQDTMSESQVAVTKRAASLPGPSYTWAESPKVKEVENHARLQDPALRARLQAALDKALQAKGYHPAADRTKADFVIAYRVGVREVQEATLQGDDGATPLTIVACDWANCEQIVVTNDSVATMRLVTTDRAEGGLMIEVIEPRTFRVLWRALNRGEVKRGDGEQASLDAIAANTLKQLPAHGK